MPSAAGAVTLNPAYFTTVLGNVFSQPGAGNLPLISCTLYYGTQPATPTGIDGMFWSGNTTINSSTFLPPTDGIIALAGPIIMSAEPVVPTFIRLGVTVVGPAVVTAGVIDIRCGIQGSGEPATVDLSLINDNIITITDIKMKLNTGSGLDMSASIANFFFYTMLGMDAVVPYSELSAMSRYNTTGGVFDKSVTVDVWSGAKPVNTEITPDGVILWTGQCATDDLFTVAGGGLVLSQGITAPALESGTPQFFRVTKEAYTGGGVQWPKCVIQGLIGPTEAYMSTTSLTQGVPATLMALSSLLQVPVL